MSEQAPQEGDLGGDKYPFSREYIDVVLGEVDGPISVRLGSYDTQTDSDEDQLNEELDTNAGRLLAMFGIEPAVWRNYVDRVERDHGKDISGKRLAVTPGNETLGKTLHDKLFWDMPMEMADDGAGEGRVRIIVNPDDQHVLEFVGQGSFWMDRYITHPITGKKLAENSLSPEELQEAWSHDEEPGYLDPENHHRMSFKAFISLAVEAEVAKPPVA